MFLPFYNLIFVIRVYGLVRGLYHNYDNKELTDIWNSRRRAERKKCITLKHFKIRNGGIRLSLCLQTLTPAKHNQYRSAVILVVRNQS